MNIEKLSLGIVGACGRGGRLMERLGEAFPGVRIHAVCDTNAEGLAEAKKSLSAAESYTSFEDMIGKSEIDALLMGTPMNFHAPHACEALKRGIHVLSEVPAGVNVEECKDLVLACRDSKATYMMAENYIFQKPNVLVGALARAGLFGTPYYAEGEYLHELKELNEKTVWRRKWQTGINGVTYGTHSLGPILQWFEGQRVVSVSCAGSGHHYKDPRGDLYENEDSCVMLCKMSGGGLAKVRVDMLSDRPHAMTNYQLQGTDGCYESARSGEDKNRIWLRSQSAEPEWSELETLAEEHLPEWYREAAEEAAKAGHGGGDYYELREFLKAISDGGAPIVGIHEAMDMTLPGLMSQSSIIEEGRWMPVPNSRDW